MKKIKKTARQKAVKKADAAMSLYVRARDKRCVLCGTPYRLQAGHLIRRGKWSVRYDERNVFCQCAGCNKRHNYYPEFYTNWWINRFGQEAYDKLVRDSQKLKHYTTAELLEIAEYFKNKLKELEAKRDGKN